MKILNLNILMFLVCAVMLCASYQSQAAPGGNPGPPSGKGRGDTAQAAGTLYGDLYVIERDGQGVPITREVSYLDAETGETVTIDCLQPIASPSCGLCQILPLNAEKPDFNPELEDACGIQSAYVDDGCVQEVKFGRWSVSRAPASVIDMSYSEALKAISSASADQCVCDYATAFCSDGKDTRAIKKDAAGRLTLCIPLEDESGYTWKTIDAPLENLGLYRELMTNGCFGELKKETVGEEGVRNVLTTALDPSGIYFLNASELDFMVCAYESGANLPNSAQDAAEQELSCVVTPDPVDGAPDDPCWWESPITPASVSRVDMLSAAVFIAAAADKTSPVTLDEIINVNTYLGINEWTYTRIKKEEILTVEYFPFEDSEGPGGWFGYTRGTDWGLPETQAYLLTVDTSNGGFLPNNIHLFTDQQNGVNLDEIAITVCRQDEPLRNNGSGNLVVCTNAGSNPVYSNSNVFGCGGANWFAQAAEDARKVIWFQHNWSVPEIEY